MQTKFIAILAGAAIIGAIAYSNSFGASAHSPGSGVIVGRVFEPGAPDYKQTQLTVLPANGADAYGVFVTAECFALVANGDPWPSIALACR